jgi:hypothetical protein
MVAVVEEAMIGMIQRVITHRDGASKARASS